MPSEIYLQNCGIRLADESSDHLSSIIVIVSLIVPIPQNYLHYANWRPLSLSELTQYWISLGLTHLGLEFSILQYLYYEKDYILIQQKFMLRIPMVSSV